MLRDELLKLVETWAKQMAVAKNSASNTEYDRIACFLDGRADAYAAVIDDLRELLDSDRKPTNPGGSGNCAEETQEAAAV